MFRLEDAIENWKEALIGDGTINAEERLELESHLRESVAALQSQSLSVQEAFLVAANRVGRPVELQQEFEKNSSASRWRYRLFWMLVGTLGLKAIGGTLAAISAMLGTAMAASGFAGSASAIAMLAATVLLWTGVIAVGFRQRKRLGAGCEGLPQVWMVTLAAMLVVAPLLSTFSRIGQARLVDPAWFGEAAPYSAIGGYSLNLFIVAFCFAAMWKLSDGGTLLTD
jgi:hypothetical protein